MLSRNNNLIALSIFGLASVASPAAIAGPAETSGPGKTAWRAMFQQAKYNIPCPLTVYSEDMSQPAPIRHANRLPEHIPAPTEHAGDAASEIIRDYVRGPGFVGADNLATYAEDLSRAGKLRAAMIATGAERVAMSARQSGETPEEPVNLGAE